MTGASTQTVSYTRQWVFFLFTLAALGGALYLRSTVTTPTTSSLPQQTISASAHEHWFLILKMPEVTKGFPPDEARVKFESWITALLKQGYHPLLLSEILRRIDRGESLPPQTVALSFDPGYLQTFQTVSPILVKHGLPAAWITNENALDRADLRFLSFHQLTLMGKSGTWDIALKDPAGKFSFSHENGSEQKKWIFGAPNTALNIGNEDRGLNRLSVNAAWSDDEFIDRLKAEQPIEGPAALTSRQIQDRSWGVVAPLQTAPAFDLAAPATKRSGHLTWLGSANCRNFKLDLSVNHVDGELWLLLRSDPVTEESLQVGFTPTAWIVQKHTKDTNSVLALTPWVQPHEGPIKADVILTDDKISVSVDGEVPFSDKLRESSTANGLIELDVYDRVRGAAQAKTIRMSVTPLK